MAPCTNTSITHSFDMFGAQLYIPVGIFFVLIFFFLNEKILVLRYEFQKIIFEEQNKSLIKNYSVN